MGNLIVLVSLALSVAIVGQTPAPKPAIPLGVRSVESEDSKWEYIVVSFGKTLFSDVADAKATGLSKTIVYSAAGFQLGQEALTTQAQMDALGKFGWELVSVVGSIGGDQEMLFKRRFDTMRSSREAKLIQDEAKALAQRRKAESVQTEASLIDQDKVDQDKQDSDYQANAQAKFTDYAGKVMASGETVTQVIATYVGEGPNQGALKVRVEIDGTSALLKDGNKYRKSEAMALAERKRKSIMEDAGLASRFGTETELTVVMTIKFGGKDVQVGTSYGFGQRFTQ